MGAACEPVEQSMDIREKDIKLVSLYDNWLLERWETPVSDAQNLTLISLTDTQGILCIILEDQHERRFQISFTRYPGYRNLLEEYRTELWGLYARTSRPECTLQVISSSWIQELKQHEPLLDVQFPNLKHLLIITGDDVIEVLSDETPIFHIWQKSPANKP